MCKIDETEAWIRKWNKIHKKIILSQNTCIYMRLLSQNTCMYMKTQNRERFENYHLFWLVKKMNEKNWSEKFRSFEKFGLWMPANTKWRFTLISKSKDINYDINPIGFHQKLALYSVSCKPNILHQLLSNNLGTDHSWVLRVDWGCWKASEISKMVLSGIRWIKFTILVQWKLKDFQ